MAWFIFRLEFNGLFLGPMIVLVWALYLAHRLSIVRQMTTIRRGDLVETIEVTERPLPIWVAPPSSLQRSS